MQRLLLRALLAFALDAIAIAGGDAQVAGIPVRKRGRAGRVRAYHTGYLAQGAGATLPARMTVGEVIGEPITSRDRRVNQRALAIRVAGLLDEFELPLGAAARYPYELSSGMRQRVALMRTLVLDTDCLLLDEHFGALDALTRSVMQAWLLGIWEKEHRTVVFITHDIEEAVFLSDRVLTMSSRPGRIKGEFIIDLPRPRTPDLMRTPEFHAYHDRLSEVLFGRGGAEA